jgi:FAD/FMN-containing dehydrogenase
VCTELTIASDSENRIKDPTSIRSILFQGMTCMPPTLHGWFLGFGDTPQCSVGGYPEYVVNVTTVAQIQLAVNFARERNLRLVIKNTGHDFGAKSVGKGALSVWTHHLKDARYYAEYEGHGYKGPAVKLGAGIQVWETNQLAKKHDITLVGGEGRVG